MNEISPIGQSTFDDPRSTLTPGVYRAHIVRHSDLEPDYPSATDDRTALVGAMAALSRRDVGRHDLGPNPWIEYSLPECGEWVWRLDARKTSNEFIAKAIECGFFELQIGGMNEPA